MVHGFREVPKCANTTLLEHPESVKFSRFRSNRKVPAHTVVAGEEAAVAHSISLPELCNSVAFFI